MARRGGGAGKLDKECGEVRRGDRGGSGQGAGSGVCRCKKKTGKGRVR